MAKAQLVTPETHPCFDRCIAMAHGMEAHGWTVIHEPNNITECDLLYGWGMRHPAAKQHAIPYMIMEHGYIGDRYNEWSTAGFESICNHMTTVENADYARMERYFPNLLKPAVEENNKAIVLGQIQGDLACEAVDIEDWCASACTALRSKGYEVSFKAHPRGTKRMRMPEWVNVIDKHTSAEQAVKGHSLAVAYSSTALVEAACEGLQISVGNDISVAHPLQEGMGRIEWAARLVGKQWNKPELKDGTAWEQLEPVYRRYSAEG